MTLEFNIKLPANQYINWNSIHICFPIERKSKSDDDNEIPANTISVNNIFAHWIKEIDMKKYGDNLQILPTGNTTDNINILMLCLNMSLLRKLFKKLV